VLRNRYFGLRHGESEANVLGIILSDPLEGVPRYGLTARGREQVRASVLACAGLDRDTIIYSSDFARARDSADVARVALGAGPTRLRAALRERGFGTWEGTTNANYDVVWARDREDPAHAERGVEPAVAVQGRTWALVQALEEVHRDRTLLLVAHGDALQLLATAFLRRPASEHRDVPHWAAGEVREL
jgi:glucosyl-3-phosphoglycerate phosphatase